MFLIVLFCSGFATSLFSFIYLHLCDIFYATILLNKHIYIYIYIYIYNITTLTANYLQMKMSINFVVYILYNMSLSMFNCAINKRLLDAAGLLDNSHNSAHNYLLSQ